MADIYGGFDFLAAGNALSKLQSGIQAQQANALQMQYTMEDRARADEARKLAAGAASAERLRKQQFMDTIKGGYMPAKTAVMGPGTVQGNTPASFDPEKVKNELLRRGDLSGLVTFSNAQEQIAKQQEQEAKAAGQGLINVKTSAETAGVGAENVKKFIELQRMQIDAAPDIQTIKAITAASYAPGHPLTAFHEQNGVTLEKALAGIDALAAQGKTVDQIRAQMSQGATAAAKNFADLSLTEAQTAKARGEAGGGGSGGTENERNRQLLARAMQDPEYVKTPEYAALFNMSFGPKMVEVQDPNGPPGQMINRVVNVPAPDVFPRPTFGQNALAPAPAATPPTNALAMANRYGGGAGAPTAQAPIATPPTLSVDMRTGENMVTKQPAPSGEREKQAIAKETKIEGANTIINMDEDVTNLLNKATSGGLQKAGAETYAYLTGEGTSGMEADAQLKAISAKLLFANLPNGSLGGQVSDADRVTIDKLSGDIANTDLPTNVRLSAWKKVVDIAKNVAKKSPLTKVEQKVARSVDIEHTAKQNNMSVEDTKTRLRSMGFKIEGE